ncbi:hypothetical protein EAG_01493 [Camponotus floridanus]|uniref:Uncharacterized protein n=1 Tax=Camponotus floridanus TaxID=104421 RepID=E2A8U7_CAMFO|nr:hypothetical protein EAG_01493 [Camponotus floridanus]
MIPNTSRTEMKTFGRISHWLSYSLLSEISNDCYRASIVPGFCNFAVCKKDTREILQYRTDYECHKELQTQCIWGSPAHTCAIDKNRPNENLEGGLKTIYSMSEMKKGLTKDRLASCLLWSNCISVKEREGYKICPSFIEARLVIQKNLTPKFSISDIEDSPGYRINVKIIAHTYISNAPKVFHRYFLLRLHIQNILKASEIEIRRQSACECFFVKIARYTEHVTGIFWKFSFRSDTLYVTRHMSEHNVENSRVPSQRTLGTILREIFSVKRGDEEEIEEEPPREEERMSSVYIVMKIDNFPKYFKEQRPLNATKKPIVG